MSRYGAVMLVVLSLACASSSSSIGQTEHFYANKSQLFMDAEGAILALGGTIISSNRSMGFVAGRFDVEGTPVDLHVDIKGSPSPNAATGPADFDVTARASLAGDREPDENWTRQLQWFEDEYMRILSGSSRQPGTRVP